MADKLLEVDLGSSFIPIQIVAGYTHTCALSISNAKCWGYNSRGQLGYDDGIDRGDGTNEMGDNLPNIALGSSFTPTQIVAAFYHTCALSTDNKVKCWGENFYGQLGYEDQVDRGDLMGSNEMGDSLPNIDLGSGFTPTQIMVGEYHTCALSSSNKVKCWGKNNYGQLGYGDMNDRGDGPDEMGNNLLDVDLGSSFIPIQIMGGSYHTCALSMNHKIKCWGRNNFGQLGYEDVQNRGDGSNEMGNNLLGIDLGSSFTATTPSPITTAPSGQPTIQPTVKPTMQPAKEPTISPISVPTHLPTLLPTFVPSTIPTNFPTLSPTSQFPTINPTAIPSKLQSDFPTISPILRPTPAPTSAPISRPTQFNERRVDDMISFSTTENKGRSNDTNNTSNFPIEIILALVLVIIICFVINLRFLYKNKAAKSVKNEENVKNESKNTQNKKKMQNAKESMDTRDSTYVIAHAGPGARESMDSMYENPSIHMANTKETPTIGMTDCLPTQAYDVNIVSIAEGERTVEGVHYHPNHNQVTIEGADDATTNESYVNDRRNKSRISMNV
eukprot:661679_1